MGRFADILKIVGLALLVGCFLQMAFPLYGFIPGVLVILAGVILEER